MNPTLRFEPNTKFKVDIKKARKEMLTLGHTRLEILEQEHLHFAIEEMRMFGQCSLNILKQYNLMNLKELENFVRKFTEKGIFK